MVYDQASYLQISVQREVPALPLLGQLPMVSVLCGHARRRDASVLKKKNNNCLLKLNTGSLCC